MKTFKLLLAGAALKCGQHYTEYYGLTDFGGLSKSEDTQFDQACAQ